MRLLLFIIVAFIALTANVTVYAIVSTHYEFTDDLANSVDLKFDRKGELKNFQFVLFGKTFDGDNLQIASLTTNDSQDAFTAFFYGDTTVIFTKLKTIGQNRTLTLWEQQIGHPAIKFTFSDDGKKYATEEANNDIALLTVIENTKILAELKQIQTTAATISTSDVRKQIQEVLVAEKNLEQSKIDIEDFVHLRTIMRTVDDVEKLKTQLVKTRASFVIANTTGTATQTHWQDIWAKIQEKKTGLMSWEDYKTYERLNNMHAKSILIKEQLNHIQYRFWFMNDTSSVIDTVEDNVYGFTKTQFAELKKWLDNG